VIGFLLPLRSFTSFGEWSRHASMCVCLTNFMWRATPNPKCHVAFSKLKLNVNWHLHFIPKCHLNIWLTQYFKKLIFWMICNKKKTINFLFRVSGLEPKTRWIFCFEGNLQADSRRLSRKGSLESAWRFLHVQTSIYLCPMQTILGISASLEAMIEIFSNRRMNSREPKASFFI
jgi:hypothetical protein